MLQIPIILFFQYQIYIGKCYIIWIEVDKERKERKKEGKYIGHCFHIIKTTMCYYHTIDVTGAFYHRCSWSGSKCLTKAYLIRALGYYANSFIVLV